MLGTGKGLFASGTVPAAFKELEPVAAGQGVTYHRLERAGKPEYGRAGG